MSEETSLLLAGFQACYDDAVFYLTRVEGLSETDPVVMGLKQHLDEQRRQLQISLVMEKMRKEAKESALFCGPFGYPENNCGGAQADARQRDPAAGGARRPFSEETQCAAERSSVTRLPFMINNPDILAIASELLDSLSDDPDDWIGSDSDDWSDSDSYDWSADTSLEPRADED